VEQSAPTLFSQLIPNLPDLDRVQALMDTSFLDIKFAPIGARLKIADHPTRRNR
jgi:hypothetical protein